MATKKDGLTGAVTEAESAVAAVKDPELRRAAFEKVLAHLLEAQAAPARKGKAQSTDARPRAKKRAGPQGRIGDLIDEGFFKKPRTISEVKAELANRGHHIPLTSLGTPLRRLCTDKRLRRQKGIAADGGGYGYTNW